LQARLQNEGLRSKCGNNIDGKAAFPVIGSTGTTVSNRHGHNRKKLIALNDAVSQSETLNRRRQDFPESVPLRNRRLLKKAC
jgi:hypothetical protein